MKKTFATLVIAAAAASITLQAPSLANGPKGCPPGLVNKGCTPPGLAKKSTIGQPVPDGSVLIRDYRHYGLQPPPNGYFYVRMDRDVLLVTEATRKVAELVTILGEIGN